MKKILYILVAMMTMSAFSSCAGLVEEENFGNPTIESMMGNEENIILLVGQAYADLKWVHDHWGYWGVASLTSDECLNPVRMPGEHWKDSYYWKRLNTHDYNWMGDAFRNIWNTTISGAVLCNKIIYTLTEYKTSMPESMYVQYVAELEVLRSYYYYLLFDCFGRIPYLEEYVEKTEPLYEPEMVWSKLVNCLERNIENLPKVTAGNRAANYGRVTQGFIYTLLARLYLNAESFGCTADNVCLEDNSVYRDDFQKISTEADFYTNAVRCCEAVIDSKAYTIADDYFSNFQVTNENSQENIFVLVENGNADFEPRYIGKMMNKYRGVHLTHHYCLQTAYGMVEKPWNGFCARPTFIDLFDSRDMRGPGPLPPAAPDAPEKEKDMTDKEYENLLEEEYYPKLKEYIPMAQGYGTMSEKRWGWFVGPIFHSKDSIYYDENGVAAICRKEVTSLEGATWYDGARCNKYEVDKTGTYAWAENDFVLMRYADVLWMKEEAILRGGAGVSGAGTAEFKKMLLRTFAYEENPEEAFAAAYPDLVSLDVSDLDRAILDERGREFAWECVRRRDLIRFGKFGDPKYVQYVTKTEKFRNWFPIPYSVLEKSKIDETTGKRYWTQNEGYQDI